MARDSQFQNRSLATGHPLGRLDEDVDDRHEQDDLRASARREQRDPYRKGVRRITWILQPSPININVKILRRSHRQPPRYLSRPLGWGLSRELSPVRLNFSWDGLRYSRGFLSSCCFQWHWGSDRMVTVERRLVFLDPRQGICGWFQSTMNRKFKRQRTSENQQISGWISKCKSLNVEARQNRKTRISWSNDCLLCVIQKFCGVRLQVQARSSRALNCRGC